MEMIASVTSLEVGVGHVLMLQKCSGIVSF